MHGQLDDARQAGTNSVAGLAQVIAGIGPLRVVYDERAILKDAHVKRRYDRLKLARRLTEEVCV